MLAAATACRGILQLAWHTHMHTQAHARARRMWYQLKTTSGSVLGAAGMCSALGGTTTLLASLDLASPPAAHTRGAHGHDPFLAVGLDAKVGHGACWP